MVDSFPFVNRIKLTGYFVWKINKLKRKRKVNNFAGRKNFTELFETIGVFCFSSSGVADWKFLRWDKIETHQYTPTTHRTAFRIDTIVWNTAYA